MSNGDEWYSLNNSLVENDVDLCDADLVKLSTSEPAAFSVLYNRYVKQIYRYVYSRIGNKQDSEDITSQTFIAALKGIDGYLPSAKFPAWLFSIARNKIADHFRSMDTSLTLLESKHSINAKSAEEHVEITLMLERVTDALTALSKDRANAIKLCFFGGLEATEIADVLDKSEMAVKMLISRGLRDLSERLSYIQSDGDNDE